VEPERLREALRWAVARHPALRAAAQEPQERGSMDNPFFHGGTDGRWKWVPSSLSVDEIVDRALEVIEVEGDLDDAWRSSFEASLDKSTFDLASGPLWGVRLMRDVRAGRSALLFSMVHALDDQRSGNILLHDILSHMEAAERGVTLPAPLPLALSKSLEDVFLTDEIDVGVLVGYALSQAEAGGKPSVMIPSALRSRERGVRKHWALEPVQPVAKARPVVVPVMEAEGEQKYLMSESINRESIFSKDNRRNLVSVRTLPADILGTLRQMCRQNNVTVSMAVATAAVLAASDLAHDDLDFGYEAYRLLLGVDMRRFAPGGDWTNRTLAFASGAMDFTLRLLPKSGEAYKAEFEDESLRTRIGGVPFWDLSRAAAFAVNEWVSKGYAAESTRLFDLGVRNLRMEKIIEATANDPATLGRAYSVAVSNAGLFGMEPEGGTYGSLRLANLFFGISSAVSGCMVAASCLTVNGELQLTAHASTPLVNRSDLDGFAESMIRSLTLAAHQPVHLRGSRPLVDNPIDARGGKPWYYPVETPKGSLQCPVYEDIKSPRLPPFDIDKYVGIWYELAFHDITQFNGCGCTQFNMTRKDLMIEDMFTVSCPWPWREGVEGPWLPGFGATGDRRLNLWTCNMTMLYEPARPGVMRETGFGQAFDNMVLEIWSDPDITAKTGHEYTRSIQFQCLGSKKDGITFVGINFLSRVPIVSPPMLQEMFVRARALGLEPYGSNDMHIVEHEGCKYPASTDRSWMGDRPEWPYPVFAGDFGANL